MTSQGRETSGLNSSSLQSRPDESLRYVALLQRRFIVACSGIEVSSIMSGVGKVRDLPRDSHFAFRLRPPSAPRCCSDVLQGLPHLEHARQVQTLVERACTEGCAAEAASLPSLSPFCWQVLALFNDRGVLRQGPAMDPADHGAGKERDAAAEGRRLVALLPDDEVSDSRKLPDHGTGLLIEGQDASKFAGFRRASSARSATGRLQRGACTSTAL